ncbi:hypothetical protein INN71_12345 [Nocardioides sp. ChNu-153]|uniref:hypothetical protein n=1 Tax=Nocardioides sp. ChNu-153 TaxID=2779364 RepID=UPI00264E8F28|nr:hypothetical protein [Nocardioides sp. ChNu-153]MDN7122178.1 hypothetical protein [Nocardioides sp. ChNu-153]
MSDHEPEQALHVSPSARGQLPVVAALVAVWCFYPVLGLTGVIGPWLVVIGMVVFGWVVLLGVRSVLRTRRSSWELRLDHDGVTVRDHPTVPWSGLRQVRVTGLRPRWMFWASFGYRVVAFVGRPGIDLPSLPSSRLTGPVTVAGTLGVRLRQCWYGTQLLVMPYAVDASAATIADAVQRFSDVPVRRG